MDNTKTISTTKLNRKDLIQFILDSMSIELEEEIAHLHEENAELNKLLKPPHKLTKKLWKKLNSVCYEDVPFNECRISVATDLGENEERYCSVSVHRFYNGLVQHHIPLSVIEKKDKELFNFCARVFTTKNKIQENKDKIESLQRQLRELNNNQKKITVSVIKQELKASPEGVAVLENVEKFKTSIKKQLNISVSKLLR